MRQKKTTADGWVYKCKDSQFQWWYLCIAALIVFGIAFIVIEVFPFALLIRTSFWYNLVLKTLVSIAVLYFTWIQGKSPRLPVKILLTIAWILFVWLPLVVYSDRVLLLLDSGVLFVLLFCVLYLYLRYKRWYGVLNACTLIVGMYCFFAMDRYTFVNTSADLHFWVIPLLISIFSAVICAVLLYKRKIVLKDNRVSERICLPIVIFGLCFSILWSTLCNLNYILDTSVPTAYSSSIVSKEIRTHSRGPADYIFRVRINGDIVEINVSSVQYDSHDEGDPYPILLYDGAFSDPYYIPQEL